MHTCNWWGKCQRSVHDTVVTFPLQVVAGLAYEYVTTPWDNARRFVYLDRTVNPARRSPVAAILLHKVRSEGILPFFQHAIQPHSEPFAATRPKFYTSAYTVIRAIARAGPWGIGFLVWETYGSNSHV